MGMFGMFGMDMPGIAGAGAGCGDGVDWAIAASGQRPANKIAARRPDAKFNFMIFSIFRSTAHNRSRFNRNALPMTETELSDIASAATIGLSTRPRAG